MKLEHAVATQKGKGSVRRGSKKRSPLVVSRDVALAEELVGAARPIYNNALVNFETDELFAREGGWVSYPFVVPKLHYGFEPYQESSLALMEEALKRIR